jgi:hypothetical protein
MIAEGADPPRLLYVGNNVYAIPYDASEGIVPIVALEWNKTRESTVSILLAHHVQLCDSIE